MKNPPTPIMQLRWTNFCINSKHTECYRLSDVYLREGGGRSEKGSINRVVEREREREREEREREREREKERERAVQENKMKKKK